MSSHYCCVILLLLLLIAFTPFHHASRALCFLVLPVLLAEYPSRRFTLLLSCVTLITLALPYYFLLALITPILSCYSYYFFTSRLYKFLSPAVPYNDGEESGVKRPHAKSFESSFPPPNSGGDDSRSRAKGRRATHVTSIRPSCNCARVASWLPGFPLMLILTHRHSRL